MLRTERHPRLTRVQAVAVFCLVAGFAGEALFHRARIGINFTIFIALAAVVHAAFTVGEAPVWRRVVVAMLPALASVPVFWFDTQWARFFALPMSVAWLLLVPRLVEHGFSLAVFGRLPERASEAVVRLAPALARTVKLPLAMAPARSSSGARTLGVGLALGVPCAIVFMVLFSFDAKFARVLATVGRGSDDAVGFVTWSLVIATALMVLVFVDELRAIGAARAAHVPRAPEPYRSEPVVGGPEPSSRLRAGIAACKVTPGAWSLVLAQVSAVFALYVALHARELFVGHEYVRTTHGVTYANQLHGGFFSLLVATFLSVGLVLVGHALFANKRAEMDAKSARVLGASELALVALGIPTLASCAQKLGLYVEAYGQTYLRLGVVLAVVMTFPLLVLTAVKSARPTWGGFGPSVTMIAMSLATLAGFFDADAHVARVNVARALDDKPYHHEYLASLGDRVLAGIADARPEDAVRRAKWRRLAMALAPQWDGRVHERGRGYRRVTGCEATLGAELCDEARAQWSEASWRASAPAPEAVEAPAAVAPYTKDTRR